MIRWRLTFLLTVIVGAALDLWSKWAVFASPRFGFGHEERLIGDWFSFQLAYNPGAVWGILGSQTDLLTVFSLIAVGFLLYLLWKEPRPTWYFQLILGLIVGGAVGNLYDRIVISKVRDFIVVWLGSYRWPTFNVADSWICIGVALFIIREMVVPAPEDAKASRSKS